MALLNIGIGISLIVLATAVPPVNRQREGTDNLRVFTAFPHGVAAFTSSNDTVFKCSTATRTHFNPQAKTVTYVWHFKDHSGHRKRDVVFNIKFGDTPGQGTWNVDNDTAHNYTAFYEYSDYETCVVMKFTFEGHEHCALWVRKAVKHNVPKHCLDKYEEKCDYRVPLIDRDLCHDDED